MVNILFPKICYGCQKEGEILCTNCFNKLIKVDPINRCHICNKESRIGFAHKECIENTYVDGVINLSIYDGLIKKIIYDIKYNFYFRYCESVGKIMAGYLQFYNFYPENTVITYVPTSNKKLKARGFNQSQQLARYISKNSQYILKPILKKSKNTGAQAKLGKSDRAENLKNAFILNQAHENLFKEYKNIIIIDDVYTTGATLNECAKTIKLHYSEIKIFGFVIAKARN